MLDFTEEILEILETISKDKIPNILLKVAQIYTLLKPELKPSQWEGRAKPVLEQIMENSEDADVKYFSQ